MKIAVTGASGHIGYSICKELLSQGFEVKALVRQLQTLPTSLQLEEILGDVMDTDSLHHLLTDCQAVIHTAGIIDLDYKHSQIMYNINVQGSKNVVDIAKEKGIKRFVHFSSVHAYSQKPHNAPVDEYRHFIGENALYYDQTKRDAHQYAIASADTDFEVIVLCPTSVIGPPDHKVSKLGQAVIDICKGKVPAVVRGGFDFVDVRDIAKGAVSALSNGRSKESYILGNEYLTIKAFSNEILAAAGQKKRLKELPLFMAYVGLPFVKAFATISKRPAIYDRAYIDILADGNACTLSEKAKKELNYAPRPIKETLQETVTWFKKEGKL